MEKVRDSGFTLVEMMIALLVLAVLILVAAPAFTNLIKDNRMLTEVYGLRAALNNARSEALSQRTFVTLCRSNDGLACAGTEWDLGFIAFTDRNGDGTVDDPNDPDGDDIFVTQILDAKGLEKFTFSNGANRVRFDSRGFARGFEGTFTLCDDRNAPSARGLIVTAGGIVRAAQDPNETGVVKDHEGNDLDCS